MVARRRPHQRPTLRAELDGFHRHRPALLRQAKADPAFGLEPRSARPGNAGDRHRQIGKGVVKAPAAISPATASLTAPKAASVAACTPSISILAALE